MKSLFFIVAVIGLAILLDRTGILHRDLPPSPPALEPADPVPREPGGAPPVRPGATPHPALEAQRQAIRQYPALAKRDSQMNKAFVNAYEEMKRSSSQALARPDWPLKLADQTASAVPSRRATPKVDATPLPTKDEDLWTAPDGLNFTVAGRVLSASPRGVLLGSVTISYPAIVDIVIYTNPLDGSKRYKRGPGIEVIHAGEVFVYGATDLADGEDFSGRVCPAAIYYYTAVNGVPRAVKGYATSTDLAKNPAKN